MPNFNTTYADQLVGFFRTDLWKIIRRRANIFINTLEKSALDKLNQHELDNAQYYSIQALGVRTLLDIAERIPGELQNGTLDVDALLGVIENKPDKPKEKSWLNRILVRLKILK